MISLLTGHKGLWWLHSRPHPSLHPKTPFLLPSKFALAQQRNHNWQLGRNFAPELAVRTLSHLFKANSPTYQANLSSLRSFISPILIPSHSHPIPISLSDISPITSPANPMHTSLSCALLHPANPSCSRVSLTHHLSAFPSVLKIFALILSLFSLPRYHNFVSNPQKEFSSLITRILRLSVFFTCAVGTSWSSICFLQTILPRTFLPTRRWLLSGFLGGLWAYILDPVSARANSLYSVRASIDSLWKVGKKRGWWRGVKGGDLVVLVLGMAVLGGVSEIDEGAIRDGVVRRLVKSLRGYDRVTELKSRGRKEREE